MYKNFLKHYRFDFASIDIQNYLFWAATHDYLSETLNRLGFDLFIDMICKKKETFTFLVVDIDDLSKINNFYGHNAGDEAIKKIASVLIDNFKNIGVVCRWGGDEFVIVTKENKSCDLKILMDNISKICLKDSIRISYGISEFIPSKGDEVDEVIDQADARMYLYKKAKKSFSGMNAKYTEKQNQEFYKILDTMGKNNE